MKKQTHAFANFELLVVLSIIAIIVGVGVAILKPKKTGCPSRVDMDLQALTAALRLYEIKGNVFPSTQQGLISLVTRPSGEPQPAEWTKLLDKEMLDPWGRPYQYRYPGKHNPDRFDIWSLGPDGEVGYDFLGNWDRNFR